VLDLLSQLEDLVDIVERRGIVFSEFLGLRRQDPEGRGRLPRIRLFLRAGASGTGGGEYYFWSEAQEDQFRQTHQLYDVDPDMDQMLGAEGRAPGPAGPPSAASAVRKELHEVRELERVFGRLSEFGLSLDDYNLLRQQSPSGEELPTRFALVSPDPKAGTLTRPIANLAQIVPTILDTGKHGIEIKRFKGLGEMDAEQLWETTMNPANRVLLKVTWDAASQAEQLFSILMGEEVEPRRQYIEEHALEVKNLDV
jgi:DNA gyrase subunit B